MKSIFAFVVTLILLCPSSSLAGQGDTLRHYEDIARNLLQSGLKDGEAYAMLSALTSSAGHRLSGSPGAAAAVELTRKMMQERGFNNVRLEPVIVPHWVRGPVEEAVILKSPHQMALPLSVCALGGSIATPKNGITAEVVEVHSFDELQQLGDSARGKIVFFNRPMDPTKLNTFEAYGGAVDQRSSGAMMAAKAGGVAAIVRSMTLILDDFPHTGAMDYEEGVTEVPAAAVSTSGAARLSERLKNDKHLKLRLKLTCRKLPDVPSANVLGEITGSEKPQEIIVVGGHLDCWDKGTGAHDDGQGCIRAIEVLNLLKKLGLHPKRTVRAVMFMNEENGNRGGKAYVVAPGRTSEKHIAVIESDAGAFAPRGISVQGDSLLAVRLRRWEPLFALMNAGKIEKGFSGVDVSPMVEKGVPGFGLEVETHRYFDYHHSDKDTIDKVNPRELELGAVVEAFLCYLISEEGL